MSINLNFLVPNYSPAKIKKIRERSKVTPTMLASVLGVSYKTLQSWEAGTEKMPLPERRLMTRFRLRSWLDFWIYKFMK